MRKDTLARRALALALLAPLAAVGCADEGMDEDLDTDFDATTETTDARGEQFDLEAMNDSEVEGEGWALTRGDSLVVTLNLEGQAATEELALFVHRGTCGDEAAPVAAEMERDRMAATGAPTTGTPGQPATGQTDQPGQTGDDMAEDAPATTGTGTTTGTGQMGGVTYAVALSELGMGMGARTGTDMEAEDGTDPTTGTDAGMDGAGTDEEFSVRAHPAGTTEADLGMGAEDEEGRALFCGDIPEEALRGGAAGTTAPTGTPAGEEY